MTVFKLPLRFVLIILTLIAAILLVVTVYLVLSQYPGTKKHSVLPVLQTQAHKPVYYHDRAVVIYYHNLGNTESGTCITPAHFNQHLNMLAREGFNVIPLQKLEGFLEKKDTIPVNAVVITFDDGAQNNYTLAYPILKKKHLSATFFVIVSAVEKNSHLPADNKKWMGWSELHKMSANNMSIGSHSYAGHKFISGYYPQGAAWFNTRLKGESQPAYELRIYQDLLMSRHILQNEKMNLTDDFAIPFGIYNDSLIKMAYKAGYKYIWTTRMIPVKPDSPRNNLGRVSVGHIGLTAPQLKQLILTVAKR